MTYSNLYLGGCELVQWCKFFQDRKYIYTPVFTFSHFLCRPQQHGSTPRGTPWNFDRNRGGVSKKRLSTYKSSVPTCCQSKLSLLVEAD